MSGRGRERRRKEWKRERKSKKGRKEERKEKGVVGRERKEWRERKKERGERRRDMKGKTLPLVAMCAMEQAKLNDFQVSLWVR